jgi:hypothetical protein
MKRKLTVDEMAEVIKRHTGLLSSGDYAQVFEGYNLSDYKHIGEAFLEISKGKEK